MYDINWTNPSTHITAHFTVKDALWLDQWGRLANEADGLTPRIKANIVKTASWMEKVRIIVGGPIYVRSWWRPPKYNVAIGGALHSEHMQGNAVDWWADKDGDGDKDGADCDLLKADLMPFLESFNLRMENNGARARWIHLDDKALPPGGHRFFKP